MTFSVEKIGQSREDRFKEHLPDTDDLALLALKGHLLVEEILDVLIKSYCAEPRHLDSVEIRFFVKAKIARALTGNIFPDSMWKMIDALNTVRNDLAHALESKKLKERIRQFINIKYEHNDKLQQEGVSPDGPDYIAKELAKSIHYLLGQLSVAEIVARFMEYQAQQNAPADTPDGAPLS
jgi:hypothetical protein